MFDRIAALAIARAPDEVCGVLVGRCGDGRDAARGSASPHIDRALPAANVHVGDRTMAYELDPACLLRTLSRRRSGSRRVLGFYHSHTTGGAQPSITDQRSAWDGCLYLIVAVRDHRVVEACCWSFSTPAARIHRRLMDIGG